MALTPNYFPLALSLLAYLISANRSKEELALLSAAFNQLGDTIATILAAKALDKKCSERTIEFERSI